MLEVTLRVNNLDDTAPTIISEAVANTDENNQLSGLYTQRFADDSADVETNSVTYSLADGHDPVLSINEVSGEVILSSALDSDVQNQYSFLPY